MTSSSRSLLRRSCGSVSQTRPFWSPDINRNPPLQQKSPRVLHEVLRTFHASAARLQKEESKYSIADFKKSLRFPQSTLRVRDVTSASDEHINVVLHGYLGVRADLSKRLTFVCLRDIETEDEVQLISAPKDLPCEAHEVLKTIKPHEPVAVEGILRPKPAKKDLDGSSKERTKEVFLERVYPLNQLGSDVVIKDGAEYSLEQRSLRLRTDAVLRKTLRLRDQVMRVCHDALQDFVFVETPLLFKSSSEGASEFIVPTRRNRHAYALPQSPQQCKQILMAGGIAKYYQFAKCFRDEDLRADRQPEFTQLDLEMSFATSLDVMKLITELVRRIWTEILSFDMPDTFPVMPYSQAMAEYGSDKPDLRIPFKIHSGIQSHLPGNFISMISATADPAVDVMRIQTDAASPSQARDFINNFLDSLGSHYVENPHGAPGISIVDPSQPLRGLSALGFEAADVMENMFQELDVGDILVFQARPNVPFSGGSTTLGNMRLDIHDAAVKADIMPAIPWKTFEPVWVVDFPLFSPDSGDEPGQGGRSGFSSTHHPFTSPKNEKDVDLLLKNPREAIGDHYDLVINGEEIGGGSRRIHSAPLQELVFRDVLKMEEAKIQEFAPLLEALKSACPPHAGIALGFDRLIALLQSHLLGRKISIRDTIAFPKSGSGEDPMMKSPGLVTEEQLERYHLHFRT